MAFGITVEVTMKKISKEEYDVGHRGHAERFVYLCSSF